MVDAHTFINHEGVNTYLAKLYLEGTSPPNIEVTGINTPDKDGNTPFMYAIKFTNPEIATLLLKRGADINAKNNAGETAMNFAANRTDREARKVLVNFLLNMEIDEESKKLGREALEKYELTKKEEEELLKLEEKVRNFKANPVYVKKLNRLRDLMSSMYKYDVIQGKLKAHKLPRRVHKPRQLTEEEKEEVRKLNEQIQPLKEWIDKANAELKILTDEQANLYEKRRQTQKGSRRYRRKTRRGKTRKTTKKT